MKITRADKEKANRELPYPKLMVNRTGGPSGISLRRDDCGQRRGP